MVNIQKAAMIGCGAVGATSAFSLMQSGLFSELVLIDANQQKADGGSDRPQPRPSLWPSHENLCRYL